MYKDICINFMNRKNDIIKSNSKCNVDYITQEDLEDINGWDEDTCRSFIESIQPLILSDAEICPWCYKYDNNCNICSYAKRHGVCDMEQSNYNIILRNLKVRSSFTKKPKLIHIPEICDLCRKLDWGDEG